MLMRTNDGIAGNMRAGAVTHNELYYIYISTTGQWRNQKPSIIHYYYIWLSANFATV